MSGLFCVTSFRSRGWSGLPARSALQSANRFEVSAGDPRPLATLARLSLPTLQRKQSADADCPRRKVRKSHTVSQTVRTAAFQIRTFMSYVPYAPSSRTADGATSNAGNMCWTNAESAFWMKLETVCSTLPPPPTGASRKRRKHGGSHGLTSATSSLPKRNWTAVSTTAAMPIREWNRSPPFTRASASGQ